MRLLKLLLLSLFLYLYLIDFAQNNGAGSPVQALLSSKQSVAVSWQNKYISVRDTPFNTFPQNLLKTKEGLYLFVNGSGRLYQLKREGNGIQPQRIDSTLFFGYNFGSFPFVYHDTIYSLGGYGMWRINGQLRAYIAGTHSWDIVPLNEEVPVLTDVDNRDMMNMLWYDKPSGKLYIAYSTARNQAIKHSSLNEVTFDYTVRCLNLQTKEWQEKGELNSYFKDKTSLIKNIAFTPWGQLISFGNKVLLIDYNNNKVFRLSDEIENQIRPVLFEYPTDNLYYCIDSTLFFGNVAENRLNALPLHKNNFIDSHISVYNVTNYTGIAIAALTLLAFLVAGWLWHRKKRSETSTIENIITSPVIEEETIANITTTAYEQQQTEVKPAVIFSEKEARVIQLIANNSRNNRATSADELNRLLGLTNTNNDNQKVQRNKLFKSVNEKYCSWKCTEEELIQSQRSQQSGDGRNKEYYIAVEKLNELEAIFCKVV